MHAHGVVHLNLKADNVLLYMPSGRMPTFPMLTDYGLAMQFTPGRLERPSVGRGTRPYMAPEILQATGEKTDIAKIDVYAFGCLLWEMLAGKVPWEDLFAECSGDHAAWEKAVVEQVLSGERPGIDNSWPELLRALMEQCWARAADARPTMQAVQANLATGVSSGGQSARGSRGTSFGAPVSGSTSAADDTANLSAAEREKKRLAEAVRRREAEETRRKMKEAEPKATRD
jgi:serine/threonine protein kinase